MVREEHVSMMFQLVGFSYLLRKMSGKFCCISREADTDAQVFFLGIKRAILNRWGTNNDSEHGTLRNIRSM